MFSLIKLLIEFNKTASARATAGISRQTAARLHRENREFKVSLLTEKDTRHVEHDIINQGVVVMNVHTVQ